MISVVAHTQAAMDVWYPDELMECSFTSTQLLSMVQSYDWAGTLARLAAKPAEAQIVGMEGRTPLHVACDHNAPLVVIEGLLEVYPQATTMVGTTGMNPLHITCSSQHASPEVVSLLLRKGYMQQASMRDVDGDTPLHAACRFGAPIEVLEMLLRAYPEAVDLRDYEGLTPLHRLWVRYFVMLGGEVFHDMNPNNLNDSQLGDAWRKTELLLRYSYLKEYLGSDFFYQPFSLAHAAAAVDCPREIVRISTFLDRQKALTRDFDGNTPLMLAAKAPVFKVRDLSDDGYMLEDLVHGDDERMSDADDGENDQQDATNTEASVIDILVSSHHRAAASMPDRTLRLPIHWALATGKKWNQGVRSLVEAHPESLTIPDQKTDLQPFLLAAASKPSKKSDLNTIYELLRTNPVACI